MRLNLNLENIFKTILMNYKKESDSNSNFTNNYLGDLLKNKLRNYIKSEERI